MFQTKMHGEDHKITKYYAYLGILKKIIISSYQAQSNFKCEVFLKKTRQIIFLLFWNFRHRICGLSLAAN